MSKKYNNGGYYEHHYIEIIIRGAIQKNNPGLHDGHKGAMEEFGFRKVYKKMEHDFEAALMAFNDSIGACSCDGCQAIRFSLKLAQKIMQQPSEAMIDAYIAEKHAPFAEDTAKCKFEAMRDQMLKEIE